MNPRIDLRGHVGHPRLHGARLCLWNFARAGSHFHQRTAAAAGGNHFFDRHRRHQSRSCPVAAMFWPDEPPCYWCNSFTGKFSKKASRLRATQFLIASIWTWALSILEPVVSRLAPDSRSTINLCIVGDVGVGGDYRGMLKYLIRFR